MIRFPCPPEHRWRALLADELSVDEQLELDGHLEFCPDCQRTIEECAAHRSTWMVTAESLGNSGATHEPALDGIMEKLKCAPVGEDSDHAELPIDFLDPSERPGSLGRVGSYEVLQLIGRGGMGVVFKALDPGLHRIVAIKVLAPQLAVSGTVRKRFTREARAAAAVQHENVVTIHAVEEFKGLPYLVMEYVAGPSLQQRIDDTGPLPLAELLRIGMQTAAGLAAAHAQGLIHRDVKPANILLENGVERVKLTDFSLARTIDDASVTRSGVISGTPPFMAPEQARGEALDHRADLFSLGSVLYSACTGRPPFRGSHSIEVLRKVCEETPMSIRSLNPEVPNWLEAIVGKLMAPRPDDRFQSASEAAELLERCLAHVQQPTETPLPAIPGYSKKRKHPLAIALPILAGLFVIAAVTIFRIKTDNGTLVVEIDDAKASVTIDGTDIVIRGAGTQEVRLKSGSYTARVNKTGKPETTEIVSIKQGEKTSLRVVLEPLANRQEANRNDWGIFNEHLRTQRFGPTFTTNPRTGQTWTDHPSHYFVIDCKGPISSVAFLKDSRRLFVGSTDGTARVMDISDGGVRIRLESPESHAAVWAVSPDATKVVGAGKGSALRLWDLPSGKERFAHVGQLTSVNALAFTADSKCVAGAGQCKSPINNLVEIWNFDGGEAHGIDLTRIPDSLAFTPDGTRLAVGTFADGIQMFDPNAAKEMYRLTQPGRVAVVACSPDGNTLAAADSNGGVQLWDWQMSRATENLTGHAAIVTAVAFSPNGKFLATASQDGTARLWDLANDRCLVSMITPNTKVPLRAIGFSPDGRSVVCAGDDRVVRIWDMSPLIGQGNFSPIRKPQIPGPGFNFNDAAEKRVRLEFRDKPWTEVLNWLADSAGKPVLGGAKPTGTFSFIPPTGSAAAKDGLALSETIDLLNDALAAQKLQIVRTERSLTVLSTDKPVNPELVAHINADDLKSRGRTERVSIVVKLQHMRTKDVEAVINKLASEHGVIVVEQVSNSVLIQDTAGNLRTILDVIKRLDVPLTNANTPR